MEDDRRVQEYRCERGNRDIAGVDDATVVRSCRYAKGLILQVYLECLSSACHYKQKEKDSSSALKSELLKCLSSKNRVSVSDDTKQLCLSVWSTLSQALVDRTGQLPNDSVVFLMPGGESLLRLAMLADFYSFQKQVLCLDEDQAEHKLKLVTCEALKFLKSRYSTTPPTALRRSEVNGSGVPLINLEAGCHATTTRTTLVPELEAVYTGESEDPVKWSKLAYTVRRKSYRSKLINAFQAVKTLGHPAVTLASEWELSCYYKLALAYTTDTPFETAAGCIPGLREFVKPFHSEHVRQLRQAPPEAQKLLYAVLNCHINWIDHNHKQILLVPGAPDPSVSPRVEGDLRCARCLKNQTFHSSEVKGNPRNIDVEFDFKCMTFGSSCCASPMFNVPLSTRDVNTCTFTEMKQMYMACPKCTQPIFSEVLVDVETLRSQCVSCKALNVRS